MIFLSTLGVCSIWGHWSQRYFSLMRRRKICWISSVLMNKWQINTVYTHFFAQGNFIFVKEKSRNCETLCLWQACSWVSLLHSLSPPWDEPKKRLHRLVLVMQRFLFMTLCFNARVTLWHWRALAEYHTLRNPQIAWLVALLMGAYVRRQSGATWYPQSSW